METRAIPAPTLITVREAAELANVSRTHLWRLVQRGEVEAVRVGDTGPIRIDRAKFTEWLFGDPGEAA
jgi:excisionase family DNA binding protein